MSLKRRIKNPTRKKLPRSKRTKKSKKLYYDYNDRETNLKALGFRGYAAYLESELWRSIKRQVFAVSHQECYFCDNRPQVVHHLSYSLRTLSGKDLEFLKPLCHSCHAKIEVLDTGRKRGYEPAVNEFYRLIETSPKKESITRKKDWRTY